MRVTWCRIRGKRGGRTRGGQVVDVDSGVDNEVEHELEAEAEVNEGDRVEATDKQEYYNI